MHLKGAFISPSKETTRVAKRWNNKCSSTDEHIYVGTNIRLIKRKAQFLINHYIQ